MEECNTVIVNTNTIRAEDYQMFIDSLEEINRIERKRERERAKRSMEASLRQNGSQQQILDCDTIGVGNANDSTIVNNTVDSFVAESPAGSPNVTASNTFNGEQFDNSAVYSDYSPSVYTYFSDISGITEQFNGVGLSIAGATQNAGAAKGRTKSSMGQDVADRIPASLETSVDYESIRDEPNAMAVRGNVRQKVAFWVRHVAHRIRKWPAPSVQTTEL